MEWRDDASCVDADPELFAEQDRHTAADWDALQYVADTYCGACPVIAECRADGDSHRHVGMWGGTYRRLKHSRYVRHLLVDADPDPVLAHHLGVHNGWGLAS